MATAVRAFAVRRHSTGFVVPRNSGDPELAGRGSVASSDLTVEVSAGRQRMGSTISPVLQPPAARSDAGRPDTCGGYLTSVGNGKIQALLTARR